MSANEKKLADFVLDNAPLIRDYSSQQIAAAVGVSQSSVVKFSQKIGYKGFTDLKLAIHESVVKQESNVAVLTGNRGSAGADVELRDRLYHVKCDAISGATALNDDKTLQAVAAALDATGRIQFVGSGNALTIARDAAYRMTSRGKPVIAEGDAQVQQSSVATLGKGDSMIPDIAVATSQQHVIDLVYFTMAQSAGVGLPGRVTGAELSKAR
jgi:DNA-binding MurR/RpiR family transcriptional regulator